MTGFRLFATVLLILIISGSACRRSQTIYLLVSDDLQGAQVGTKMILQSNEVGHIAAINYNPSGVNFLLKIHLNAGIKIAKKSDYYIEDVDLFGGKRINISPKDSSCFLNYNDTIAIKLLRYQTQPDSILDKLEVFEDALREHTKSKN